MTPQQVTDDLAALQAQKDTTEAASAAKTGTADALVAAKAADDQAADTLAKAAADLGTKRTQFEALLESFYIVGGTLPTPPEPPPA